MKLIIELDQKLLDNITLKLAYFTSIVFILTLIESFIYYGITRNIFHIDIKLIIIIYFILFLLANKQSQKWKTILRFNKLILIPSVVFIFIALNYADMRNYTGYVFGTYHIHPQNLLLTSIFVTCLQSLSYYHLSLNQLKKNIFPSILGIVVSYALISVGINSTWIIASNYNYLVRPDLRSYDARMEAVWGDFYKYIQFVRDNTESNSTIAHPPQVNPWQMEGNQLVSRYFLYPRQLNSTMDDFYPAISKSDWLMISNGTPRFYPADFEGFPSEPIALSDIKLLNKSDVWVEPISIIIHREEGTEDISIENAKKLEIKSDTIEELSLALLETVDASVKSVEVKIKSNTPNSASLYQLSESKSIERIESISNNHSDNNLENYTLVYKLPDEKLQLTRGPIYLKITNAQPLPYLYVKAIGKISHNPPTRKDVTDYHFYEELGNYYFSVGNWTEARQAYNQALTLKPEAPEAILGLYYLAKNNNQLNDAKKYAKLLELLLPVKDKFNLGTYLLSNIEELK